MTKLLSILLQRSDPSYPWGFTVRGGLQDRAPLVIDQVTPGTLAAQYLAPGDTILQMEKVDTRLLWNSQVESLISQPGKSLDLLVLKGDSPSTFPRTSASPGPRLGYSSDSGSASGGSTGCGRDLRQRKQHFWERVSNEDKDFSKEGFTRLESGANSPFKNRSRFDQWRRCQSEEKASPIHADNYNLFAGSLQRPRKISDASSYSNRIQSVWSPNPDRSKTPTSDFWSRNEKLGSSEECQGNITFWEYNTSDSQSSEPRPTRSGSLNRSYRRHDSDFSHGYSSLSSDYTTTPKSELDSARESPFDLNQAFMKKPSDFWSDNYRDDHGCIRLGRMTSPTSSEDSVWKNSNIMSKSQFKKSTSVKQTSYSSTEGTKSFETFEHVNKTKETEKTLKTVDGGKEEVVEKTKKNKEHIIANKDDVNGQPKETTKVINDFKSIEKVMDGETEFCNKIKEHKEEVTNSNTPVNFYDNVQQHGVVETPTVQKAESCDHRVNREKEVGQVSSDETFVIKDDTDISSLNFSPLLGNYTDQQRWTSSTPVSQADHFNAGLVYEQEEPLMENYFEVDIRSPIEMEVVFTPSEEQIRRQSSQISGGGSPIPVSPQGDSQVPPPPPPPPPSSCPPAPPPPPPPGLTGNIPSVRLSTEIPDKRRSAYEPPAAIQNAMMTKDKKPFTYTPGGLDLSEIRSPRMARRINANRNACAADTPSAQPQPRPVSVPSGPLPPSAVAAMQPQIAIPVLPQGGGVPQLHHVTPGGHSAPPPPPPPQFAPQTLYSPPPQPTSPQKVINRQPSPPPMAVPKLQPQHRHTKSEPEPSTPGSIYVPPIEPQQARSQLGSLYIPPLAPQETVKPQSPVSQLNKAPTPWMSRQSQQAPKEVPPWVNREAVQSPSPQIQSQQQPQTRIIPIQIEGNEQSAKPNERIIPIQLEGTPSPQPQSQAPHFNQQPNYQQQQQQYQQQQYQQQQQQYQQQQQQYQQQQQQYQQQQQQYQQQQYQQANSGRQTPQTPRWMNQQPVYVHNKFNSGSQSPVPVEQNNGGSQPSWRHSQTNGSPQSPGPVQSQSFKVLQKITGTDGVDQSDAPYNSQGVPLSQLRKLQLSDDDRALMDKVKSQVDDETYLHNESDPRYRGSAIPSRAFRILQTMTDGAGEGSDVPRAYSPVQGGQNRLAANRTPQPDAPQQYVPPSEQQAPEPRKYTGGAIPSRSFRMLQAMTAGNDTSDRPGESEF